MRLRQSKSLGFTGLVKFVSDRYNFYSINYLTSVQSPFSLNVKTFSGYF